MTEGNMETSESINGRVVIAAKSRQLLGPKPGTKLSVEERNGEIVLRSLNSASGQKMSGILRGGGLTMALELARREDLKREDKKIRVKVLHGWALWGYLEEEPGYENSIRI
jgi:bifunctional DNA-binding transcriptional regulator/antitoxin component of YhaV-PrlF toxin-antitoxin module